MRYFTLAALAVAAFASHAHATPIVSGDGTETCNGGPCYVVPPHVAWEQSPIWIAPQPAGVFVPNYPSWTLVETFTLAADTWLEFTVWADDRAEMTFNGQAVPGTPGFRPGDGLTFKVLALTGANTFAAEVHNTGLRLTFEDNPTALAYTAAPVPLPGGLALLGAGLLGFGVLRSWK